MKKSIDIKKLYDKFYDGGAISKRWYRYQDWCAMYVLLNHYITNERSLNLLNLERGKIDFEAWLDQKIENYQIKGGDIHLTALDLNSIFRQHLLMVKEYSPRNFMLFFVFSSEPKHSLRYLINILSGNIGVKKYYKKTRKYIDSALKGIGKNNILIEYRCISEKDVECLCYGIAKKILEQYYPRTKYLSSGIVDIFIIGLREEIDRMSSQPNSNDRKVLKQDLVNLISRINYLVDTPRGTKTKQLKIKSEKIYTLLREKNTRPLARTIGTVNTESEL